MVNKRVPCFHSLCISIIGFVWRKKEGNRKQKSDQLQLCPVSLFYIEYQSSNLNEQTPDELNQIESLPYNINGT